jgi:hypothetical protein
VKSDASTPHAKSVRRLRGVFATELRAHAIGITLPGRPRIR